MSLLDDLVKRASGATGRAPAGAPPVKTLSISFVDPGAADVVRDAQLALGALTLMRARREVLARMIPDAAAALRSAQVVERYLTAFTAVPQQGVPPVPLNDMLALASQDQTLDSLTRSAIGRLAREAVRQEAARTAPRVGEVRPSPPVERSPVVARQSLFEQRPAGHGVVVEDLVTMPADLKAQFGLATPGRL